MEYKPFGDVLPLLPRFIEERLEFAAIYSDGGSYEQAQGATEHKEARADLADGSRCPCGKSEIAL
jgi:hypothetical protein